jgi:Phage capsid protein
MTDQVPAWFKQQWNTSVIQRYQQKGFMLKGMTTQPVDFIGDTFYFLRSAPVDVGGPRMRASALQPLNPQDDKLSVQSQKWDAPFRIYDDDVVKMSVNEKDVRVTQAANAIGRKSDKIVMDAVMAATLPGGNTVASVAAQLDPRIVEGGIATLFNSDVPDDGELFCGLPAFCWHQLLQYKTFANADYVGPDMPFAKGAQMKTWLRCNFFQLPKFLLNFKTVSTSNDTWRFRMWHRTAMGAGQNEGLRTEWERHMEQGNYWALNHTIDGCARDIQAEGIYEFQVTVGSTISPETINTHSV